MQLLKEPERKRGFVDEVYASGLPDDRRHPDKTPADRKRNFGAAA
jgi:hypothetical protein